MWPTFRCYMTDTWWESSQFIPRPWELYMSSAISGGKPISLKKNSTVVGILCVKSKLFRWPDELLPKVMTVCGLWPINTARCERPMELFFLTKHLPTTYLSLQMSHNKQGIIADKDFANLCQISVLTWKTWHKFLFSLGLNNFDRFFFLSLSLDNIMLLNTLPLVRDGQARVTAENWAELPALSKSHCCFSFPQCIKKN